MITETITFKQFKHLFQGHFKSIIENQDFIFKTDTPKDAIWETYINSFQEGDFRQSFNCNSCRSFLKNYGNLVVIKDNKIQTLWDFKVPDSNYQKVVDRLHNLIKSSSILNVFVIDTKKLGHDFNYEEDLDHNLIRWDHLYLELPSKYVVRSSKSIPTLENDYRTQYQVLKRGLDEISIETTETVLELIDSNSIYRGQEFQTLLKTVLELQKEYNTVKNKEIYCWYKSVSIPPSVSRFRNSSIGTLLIDISEGVDLDTAVDKFGKVMDPFNYKRPKAVFTGKMVKQAEDTINALGLSNSLERRFAHIDDLSINNLLFVDRNSVPSKSIFDELQSDVKVKPKQFSNVEEVSLEKFISDILPKAKKVEVLLENNHANKLVSLIAPVDSDSPSLFKWDNGFSWSYTGSVTDSIKERVKNAGGNVDGVFRCSLEWYNYDDLDIHLEGPYGLHIWYGDKVDNKSKGKLDVDMNAGGRSSRSPVENITFPELNLIQEGKYKLFVHQFCKRETADVGFKAQIEDKVSEQILDFSYNKPVVQKIVVAEFNYSRSKGISIIKSLPSTTMSKKLWNLDTNKFHKVNSIMFSPNYWEHKGIGNKHIFFMLEGAKNTDDQVRGLFNEFLKEELLEHKRVFEALGNRTKVNVNDYEDQLSGIGFSTTISTEVTIKVTGLTERVLKVKI